MIDIQGDGIISKAELFSFLRFRWEHIAFIVTLALALALSVVLSIAITPIQNS